MITLQGIEQFIPIIKPLFDLLRSARDWIGRRRRPERSIKIPKKTLILLPTTHPFPLRWQLAQSGTRQGMCFSGSLQATNITSNYNIYVSDIKLLKPSNVELEEVDWIVAEDLNWMVETPKTESYRSKRLIPVGRLYGVGFTSFVTPVTGTPGQTLSATISILDQFGNEHVLPDLQFKFEGPERLT